MTTSQATSPRLMLRPVSLVALLAAAFLAGCGTVDSASHSMLSAITPYRPEIVQGNVITKEQVQLLRTGLTKLQVRQLLGTPLVTSVFHANRWDYVFTINRQGTESQQRRLTVFFENDLLQKFEGDPMPAEKEFIDSITKPNAFAKPKRLEATPEELTKFREVNPSSAPAQPAPAITEPSLTSYPPLESGAQR